MPNVHIRFFWNNKIYYNPFLLVKIRFFNTILIYTPLLLPYKTENSKAIFSTTKKKKKTFYQQTCKHGLIHLTHNASDFVTLHFEWSWWCRREQEPYSTLCESHQQLGNGMDLQLHCKSRNDDLGIHVLANQQFFEWHFRNNVWGTTRFYCFLFSKSWKNSFDVYYQGMCSAHCNWFVRQNGTCLETREPYRSFCYPWPKGEREGLKD